MWLIEEFRGPATNSESKLLLWHRKTRKIGEKKKNIQHQSKGSTKTCRAHEIFSHTMAVALQNTRSKSGSQNALTAIQLVAFVKFCVANELLVSQLLSNYRPAPLRYNCSRGVDDTWVPSLTEESKSLVLEKRCLNARPESS